MIRSAKARLVFGFYLGLVTLVWVWAKVFLPIRDRVCGWLCGCDET